MNDKQIAMAGNNWYLETIEEPLRDIVRALRNNGVNTECSCGHEMYIQCQSVDPTTEFRNIRTVFMMLGIMDYKVELVRQVIDGHHYDSITIYLKEATHDNNKDSGTSPK